MMSRPIPHYTFSNFESTKPYLHGHVCMGVHPYVGEMECPAPPWVVDAVDSALDALHKRQTAPFAAVFADYMQQLRLSSDLQVGDESAMTPRAGCHTCRVVGDGLQLSRRFCRYSGGTH